MGPLSLSFARLSRGTISSPSPSPSSRTISGRDQDGPPGNPPRLFPGSSGKRSRKRLNVSKQRGRGRVGPGPAQWSGEAPGALGSHKVPPQPRQQLFSVALSGLAGPASSGTPGSSRHSRPAGHGQLRRILRSRILCRRLARSQAVTRRSACRSGTVGKVGAGRRDLHFPASWPRSLSCVCPQPLLCSQRQALGLRFWDSRTGRPRDPPALSGRRGWARRVAVDTPGPTSPAGQGVRRALCSLLPCPRPS